MPEDQEAKVCFFDIETTSLAMKIGFVLCVGYAFGDGPVIVKSILDYPDGWDPSNDRYLMQFISEELGKADMLVAHYGKGFDLKALNSKMILAGVTPLPPVPMFDTYYQARSQLNLGSHSLESLAEYFGLGPKYHVNAETWRRAGILNHGALLEVSKHCVRDVELLRSVYYKIRPLSRTHPNLAALKEPALRGVCRSCQSVNIQYRGWRISGASRQHKYICNDCHTWGFHREVST